MTYPEVTVTEDQLRLFPALKTLAGYDESNERSHSVAAVTGTGHRASARR